MTQPSAAQVLRPGPPRTEPARLHYLDWLQILAILGVFCFHAVHPFDSLADWMVKNDETTFALNLIGGFLYPWGMPLLFALSGAAGWISLQGRTPGRYLKERLVRLLIPYLLGAILLSPVQSYLALSHKGEWAEGFGVRFFLSPQARAYWTARLSDAAGPQLLNRLGYHLWFVGFLFVISTAALPLLVWIKQGAGRRPVAGLARLAQRRGGLLVFVVPLAAIRFALQQDAPADDYDWVDFCSYALFFLAGSVLYADGRFLRAIRRDRGVHLGLAIAATLYLFATAVGAPVWEWLGARGTMGFYLSWTLWAINGWCWTLVVLAMGMRRLNAANPWLPHARRALYPFFFLHQPAILLVAFYVVGWDAPLPLKILAVLCGSFALALGLSGLLVRHRAHFSSGEHARSPRPRGRFAGSVTTHNDTLGSPPKTGA